jgi:hypothetical protein
MRKGRAARTSQKPTDADSGAAFVRKFVIELFDNWPLIAETLFKAAFEALDKSPDDASRVALLRRVSAGSYERLAVDRASSKPQAPAGRNEAVKAELKVAGQGAADAFRNSV